MVLSLAFACATPFAAFAAAAACTLPRRDAVTLSVGAWLANQVLAAASAEVYLLVAGIAVDCKAIAAAIAGGTHPETPLDREATL